MQAKYCPRCNSTRLNFKPWLGLIYECRDCGWRGPLVVGEEKKLAKLTRRRKL